jgi:hypothetical protein
VHSGHCQFMRTVSVQRDKGIEQTQEAGEHTPLHVHVPWLQEWHLEGVSNAQNVLSKSKPASQHVYTSNQLHMRNKQTLSDAKTSAADAHMSTGSDQPKPWWHEQASEDGKCVCVYVHTWSVLYISCTHSPTHSSTSLTSPHSHPLLSTGDPHSTKIGGANPFQLWARSVRGDTSQAVVKSILNVNPMVCGVQCVCV